MDKGIYYRFARLDLKQFATFEDGYTEDGREIGISCKFTFAYNFSENIVCCTNSISIVKGGDILVKADLDAYFVLNPDSAISLLDGDALVIPSELQAQFASLTYGTMRGIVFAKTLGSPLNNIVLPPNDVLEVIKAPLRIPASNYHNG